MIPSIKHPFGCGVAIATATLASANILLNPDIANAEDLTIVGLKCPTNAYPTQQLEKCQGVSAGSATYVQTPTGPKVVTIAHVIQGFKDSGANYVGLKKKGTDSNLSITQKRIYPLSLFSTFLPINQPVNSADPIFFFPISSSIWTPSRISFEQPKPGSSICIQPDFNSARSVDATLVSYEQNVPIADQNRRILGQLPFAFKYNTGTNHGSSGGGVREGKCSARGAVIGVNSASGPFSGHAVPFWLYRNSISKQIHKEYLK